LRNDSVRFARSRSEASEIVPVATNPKLSCTSLSFLLRNARLTRSSFSPWAGIGLLAAAAFFGWLLMTLPPRLIETYREVESWGPGWGRAYLIVTAIGGTLFLVATLAIVWRLVGRTWSKRRRRRLRDAAPSELSPAQQQAELDENLRTVVELERDDRVGEIVRDRLEPRRQEIETKRATRTFEIVAFGTVSSGKSSLLNLLAGRDVFETDPRGGTTTTRNEVRWPDDDSVILVDTPGLAEASDSTHGAIAASAARDADLVLLVVDGPLRSHEHELLRHLSAMEKRTLICLNKSDWYSSEDREKLLGQLRSQTSSLPSAPEIVAVRSREGSRTRVLTAADGSEREETVAIEPDIGGLAERMLAVVRREGDRLLLANLLLRSRGLVESAREELRQALDDQARQVVDRAMWGAGSAAALSPFPLIDVAAGIAISTKMVVDLARVYRQEVDAEIAGKLLAELGKNLIGILGTSLAAPTVATIAAQVFKSVPGIGTIAGGMLQGIVQALITRWIGAVFIEYFRNDMRRPEGGLTGLARRQWERVTRPEELAKLVAMVRGRGASQEERS